MSPEQARGQPRRQAHGHLVVRLRALRDADGPKRVRGRDRHRYARAGRREGARLDRAAARRSARTFASCCDGASRRTRANACATSAMRVCRRAPRSRRRRRRARRSLGASIALAHRWCVARRGGFRGLGDAAPTRVGATRRRHRTPLHRLRRDRGRACPVARRQDGCVCRPRQRSSAHLVATARGRIAASGHTRSDRPPRAALESRFELDHLLHRFA